MPPGVSSSQIPWNEMPGAGRSSLPRFPRPRKYKKFGKRVESRVHGRIGRITSAEPRGKTGWTVKVTFDGDSEPTKYVSRTEREICSDFREVSEEYVPNHGDIKERIAAIMEEIEWHGICVRRGFITEYTVGKDMFGGWRLFGGGYEVWAQLWAGQGKWKSERQSLGDAKEDLMRQLNEALL